MQRGFFFVFMFSVNFTWAMKPIREYVATPDQYGLKYVEQDIKTPDGYRIKVWDIPATQKNEKYDHFSVVLCGADAGNMSYFLAPAIALANEGIHVVMFDYRGYGQSSDFAIDTTLLFHQEFLIDFEQVLNYTQTKYPENKVGTVGFSMGGYFPMITKQKLDFIIADSPMLNSPKIIEILKEKNLKLPPNTNSATFGSIPALLFFANQDKVVRLEDVLADNAETINQAKTFLVLYNGKHMQAMYANVEFVAHILRFLRGLD